MSGDIPASYDAWRTAAPGDDEPDHLKDCPRHEDNHSGEHAECTCPTPEEAAAAAAEAAADARADR